MDLETKTALFAITGAILETNKRLAELENLAMETLSKDHGKFDPYLKELQTNRTNFYKHVEDLIKALE